ncbi:unnamed protein product [Rotaria sordida]|uniref:Uncharacterized protein n=1 Tax=Rotaria sordida TaxID=392033 RepID=A0A816AIK6_9BILA|nr:unnamed protein product [Rotaria sordida]CAF1596060.1 unnamed protein product [Rotaria sordida]
MMKLFELIRSLYQIHQSLLNSSENDHFERLLSTTLFSVKSVVSLISTQDLLKNLEETLNYFKSTFNLQKSFYWTKK